MASNVDPIVGNWYQRQDKGREFEVVAFDEEEGAVEIQYFDGDVEHVDIDSWYDWDLERTENPDNWTGSVNNIETDDLGYDETDVDDGEDVDDEDWEGQPYKSFKSSSKGYKRDMNYDWDDGAIDGYQWDEDD